MITHTTNNGSVPFQNSNTPGKICVGVKQYYYFAYLKTSNKIEMCQKDKDPLPEKLKRKLLTPKKLKYKLLTSSQMRMEMDGQG